jgi:hypothetical protein
MTPSKSAKILLNYNYYGSMRINTHLIKYTTETTIEKT